jgi:hypothetical protein
MRFRMRFQPVHQHFHRTPRAALLGPRPSGHTDGMPEDEGGGTALPLAPEERPPIAPGQAELQAIRDAIAAGDHQRAIDAAVSAYGLTTVARWDPELAQDGDTDGDTKVVTIGPPTFVNPRTGEPRSLGWLVSSIAHESIHLHQLLAVHPVDGGDNYARSNTVGDDVNEAQAYDWEIRHAHVLALSPDELAELIEYREEHGLAISRDPLYARRVGQVPGGSGNNYWIIPADR